MQAWLAAPRSTHTSTRRGFKETDATELTVRPHRRPSGARDVTTVTPVARCAITSRKCNSSGIFFAPDREPEYVVWLRSDRGLWGLRDGPRGVLDLVSGQAFRSLVALAILISSTACDNVEWGGVDVRFVRPPAAPDGTTPDDSDGEEEPDSITPGVGPVPEPAPG